MQRREFITRLGGGAAAAWPLAARAQQLAMPVVGHMHASTAEADRQAVEVFEQALGQAGYINGHSVTIEYYWADGKYDRLPAIAGELVRRRVAVIVAGTPVAAIAAKQATTTIPIVFAVGSDPVRNGLVASLNRPGGNMTGATFFSNLLTAKRLGLLHELVPNAKTIGALVNPKNANAQMQSDEAGQAARAMGMNPA
jgi:putative ABC transport system substrate-binding protein